MLTACFSTGCIMETLSGSSLGQSAAEVIKLAVEYPQTLTMDRWQCFLPRTERKYVLSVSPSHSTCACFVISSQTLLCLNVRVGGQCGNRSLSGHSLPCRGDALSWRGSAAGPECWVGDRWGRRTDDSGQSRGWLELSSWCQTDWHSECSCSKEISQYRSFSLSFPPFFPPCNDKSTVFFFDSAVDSHETAVELASGMGE